MDFKMKILNFKLFATATIITLMTTPIFAQESAKAGIKSNGQLVYQPIKTVESFDNMLKDGTFYGRLRNNNFFFSYEHQDGTHDTHEISGFGASLVYKSASFNGFDFTAGVYGSYSFFNDNTDAISFIKPGKDTLSRNRYINSGDKSMYVLGQANLNYKLSKTDFTLGRQLVETFYTKSNDTKMVPNTFDGFVLTTKNLPQTTLKAAYLTKQKLRDHTTEHSVLMVGDVNSSTSVTPQWTQNDDAGMLKGLTYSKLQAAGKPTDAPLIILDIQNSSIDNLKVNFSSYVVPELLSQAMGELNYKIQLDGFSITPGFRYIQQFDNGAGAIAGASLSVLLSNSTAYKDPKSLNSKMIAARIVTKIDDYKINLAYTNILDEADLVTPWRGFPTSGYTRSMGMYNWRANTKSYRLELVKGANKTGIYKDVFIQTSILYMDGDDKKSILADSMFYYVGFVQNIPSFPEFQYRLRLGYRDFIGHSALVSDYLDSRLEFNYLF